MDIQKELSVRQFLETLKRVRFQCLGIVAVMVSAFMIVSFIHTPKYTANATVMNVDDMGSASLSGSGSLMQLVGLPRAPNEGFFRFMSIIQSRTFMEQLADALGVDFFFSGNPKGLTKEEMRGRAVSILQGAVKTRVAPAFPNILNISVELADAQRPPIVANQLFVELQKYITQHSLTKAKRLRNYVEDSIIETKAAIFENEQAIAKFYGNADPIKSVVENPFTKEIDKLSSEAESTATINPLLQVTLSGFEGKKKALLERLKKSRNDPLQNSFARLQEESQILKTINITLRQQYELAKLEEVKQEPTFQILDRAVGASLSSMSRRNMAKLGLVASTIAAFIYVLARMILFPLQKSSHLVSNKISLNTESILVPK